MKREEERKRSGINWFLKPKTMQHKPDVEDGEHKVDRLPPLPTWVVEVLHDLTMPREWHSKYIRDNYKLFKGPFFFNIWSIY